MIAPNMGRALYSSEVQQPERTTAALCDVDTRSSLRRQRRSWAAPMFCIQKAAPDTISQSDLSEECCIDADIFDSADSGLDAEVVALEKLAKAVAVDQIDRRGTVAGGFFLRV